MKLTISPEASELFARLSGDWNPVHLDEAVARRTQFGGTVVHGVHLVLAAINLWNAQGGTKRAIIGIKANFRKPLRTAQTSRLDVKSRNGSPETAKLAIHRDDDELASIQVFMGDEAHGALAPDERTWPQATPKRIGVELAEFAEGEAPLCLNQGLFNQLFPNIGNLISSNLAAGLLAATRTVGMHMPGEDSLLLRLQLSHAAKEENPFKWTVSYVSGTDVVILTLAGMGLKGLVEAMFRSRQVSQKSFNEIKEKFASNDLRCNSALIVGGSRGLGEVAAKLLVARGAEVIITYNRGKEDAQRLTQEINEGGGRCVCLKLDAENLPDRCPGEISSKQISLLLYFATPFILPSALGQWNSASFASQVGIHVSGLAQLLVALQKKWQCTTIPLRLFYPSTEFLDNGNYVAAEYAAAKAAGEIMCRQLAQNQRILVYVARLPQLKTDQTQLVAGIQSDTVAIINACIDRLLKIQPGQSAEILA